MAIFASLITIGNINNKQKTTITKAETVQPIIGGHPADPGEWPFMVFIYDKKYLESHKKEHVDYKPPHQTYISQSAIGGAYCTGSLISDQWILTAAHCLSNINEEEIYDQKSNKYIKKIVVTKKNPDDIGVAIGFTDSWEDILKDDWNKRFLEVEFLYPHQSFAENFPKGEHYSDIGLIKLRNKTSYKTISLTNNLKLVEKGNFINILGWGTQSKYVWNYSPSRYLNEAEIKITTPSNIYGYFSSYDSNVSSCKGDSGGPSIGYEKFKWVQIGIIHGAVSANCVDTYFLDVSRQLSWINSISGIKPHSGSFIGKPPTWVTPIISPTPTVTRINSGK